MAVLKHIAIKNSNYRNALDYLMFQHNEQTQKPILDENGRRILREDFFLDGINCDPMSFHKECEALNRAFRKNQRRDEIKMHHYIISFDPRDKEECGLTGERAQSLGLEYARTNFPGHQMLVCTHTDGHNQSGNIHVHIILNSLRKYSVDPQPFMERTCDSLAGYKHHLTDKYLSHLQQSLMEMCERENLHQIDLTKVSAPGISEKEYWTQKRGQEKLDERNQEIRDFGLEPRTTSFQTKKDALRQAIKDIATSAGSLEELQKGLKDIYQIDLIFKRGRFSYHLPDREKNISERTLGTDYGAEFLLMYLSENKKGISHKKDFHKSHPSDPAEILKQDIYVILNFRTKLQLVSDLQANVKAQLSRAYARKVKISNLKQMAEAIAYVQEHGYATRADLQEAYSAAIRQTALHKKSLEAARSDLNHFQELSSDDREAVLSRIESADQFYQESATLEKELRIVCRNVDYILDDTSLQKSNLTISPEI